MIRYRRGCLAVQGFRMAQIAFFGLERGEAPAICGGFLCVGFLCRWSIRSCGLVSPMGSRYLSGPLLLTYAPSIHAVRYVTQYPGGGTFRHLRCSPIRPAGRPTLGPWTTTGKRG